MGRPPLKREDPTVKTTLRLPTSLLERMKCAVGEGGVSEFIRETLEAGVKRLERKRRASDDG